MGWRWPFQSWVLCVFYISFFFKIYSIDIQFNNATKILDTACKFHIHDIVETCCQFIKKHLQISNCLSLYRFALEHNLQDLTQTIWNYVLVC